MKDYEKVAENVYMKWIEGFNFENKKYTQVSGYIFDNDNNMVIVKSENWTIPGGHPEKGETPLETLNREVMEEACITIKDIKYLGAVEVVENGNTYYQLRYTAHVDEILPFKKEWEVSAREFVSLSNLQDYIAWANGKSFINQIESAKIVWNI